MWPFSVFTTALSRSCRFSWAAAVADAMAMVGLSYAVVQTRTRGMAMAAVSGVPVEIGLSRAGITPMQFTGEFFFYVAADLFLFPDLTIVGSW